MDGLNISDISQLLDFGVLQAWGGNIASGILILVVGIYISRRVGRFMRETLTKAKRFDNTLVPLASSVVSYSITIVTVIVALGSLGIQTTSIIAVLGAAGIAIGLALQGTLSNVASGVMLLFLRPIQAGELVETGGHTGTITEIGLFTTTITTVENDYISVPNSAVWGSTIKNHTRTPSRLIDLDIGIAYSSDLDLAEKTLLGLAKDERVMDDPEPQFLVIDYGDSAITVRLRLHARNDDYWALKCDLMRGLKPAFDKAGIEIPFPQREYRILGSGE